MLNDITNKVSLIKIIDLLMKAINNSNSFTLLIYKADCNIILFYCKNNII